MTKTNEILSSEALGFDPDALAQRYAEEREKRIRPDAETQFVQLSHDSPFANKYLEEDPYSETFERAPLNDQREVIVIGGGWVGMLTAARLSQAGIQTSVSLRAEVILAVLGTGTVIPGHNATSSPIVTCRFWRKPATYRNFAILMPLRFTSMPKELASISIFIKTRCFKPG